jgi:hypothetical protein
VWVTSEASSATGRAPKGVVDLGEYLGAVGLAWVVENGCGAERGQALGLEALFLMNNRSGVALYIGIEVLSRVQQRFELVLVSN